MVFGSIVRAGKTNWVVLIELDVLTKLLLLEVVQNALCASGRFERVNAALESRAGSRLTGRASECAQSFWPKFGEERMLLLHFSIAGLGLEQLLKTTREDNAGLGGAALVCFAV